MYFSLPLSPSLPPSGLNDGHPLYPFLNHYEHIHYDEHDLMHHHYRVQRSMYGLREIELKFTAFEK